MTGSEGLRKAVYLHMAAGAVFSALLFAALLLAGYRDGLARAEDSFLKIRRNIMSMETAVEDLRAKRGLIGGLITAEHAKKSNREIMLISLEKATAEIPGARASVTDFAYEGGEMTLPVVFEFPVHSYSDAVRSIGRVEGRAFPYFEVKGVTLRRGDGTSAGEGRLEGSFRMPSEVPGNAKGAR